MGLFNNKKKDAELDELMAEQEDLYTAMKKRHENDPKPNVLTASEIFGDEEHKAKKTEEISPIEELRQKMLNHKEETDKGKEEPLTPFFSIDSSFLDDEEKAEEAVSDAPLKKGEKVTLIPEEVKNSEENKSILESCMPFIMDGKDSDTLPEEKPAYTLESVASILGLEEPDKQPEQETEEEEAEAFEETIIFKAIEKAETLPDISDIDTIEKGTQGADISFTGTMPVIINDEMLGNTRKVNISDEIFQNKDTVNNNINQISPFEDEDYEPEFEYYSIDERKSVRKRLLIERRNRFISLSISILSLITLLVFLLPVFSDMMINFSTVMAVFCCLCLGVSLFANIDIFKSFTTLFSKRASAETSIAYSLLLSTVGVILCITEGLASEVFYGLTIFSVLSLTFRAYFRFRKSQYMFTNFTVISANTEKYGIALIDDAPTTFAMARRAIDGDILVAAPRRTRNITNFIKNSTIDKDFDGRARLLFFIALGVSLFTGLAFGIYRNNFLTGVTSSCIFAWLFTPFTSLAPNILPLSSAAKHLNRYGAALTGIKEARKIEEANACVINSNELFPKGSIKLMDMKILSENNLEETIACACAITSKVKSPLAPVFKTIMETNKQIKIPVADSIKYEEKLGITGWVGKKRVFIGNRTLMLAHEIQVPDAEIDKKILREGFFPVYLALDGKALALIVLKYVPDKNIAKELDRICALGLTLLVYNCDQNICEEMICDYFDLYSDAVKLMSGSGVHMLNTAVNYTDSMNAGAVSKGGTAAFAATIFAANRVKRAVSLWQVIHFITAVLGVIIFAYALFGNTSLYISGVFAALYQLICFIIGYIIYLFQKP